MIGYKIMGSNITTEKLCEKLIKHIIDSNHKGMNEVHFRFNMNKSNSVISGKVHTYYSKKNVDINKLKKFANLYTNDMMDIKFNSDNNCLSVYFYNNNQQVTRVCSVVHTPRRTNSNIGIVSDTRQKSLSKQLAFNDSDLSMVPNTTIINNIVSKALPG